MRTISAKERELRLLAGCRANLHSKLASYVHGMGVKEGRAKFIAEWNANPKLKCLSPGSLNFFKKYNIVLENGIAKVYEPNAPVEVATGRFVDAVTNKTILSKKKPKVVLRSQITLKEKSNATPLLMMGVAAVLAFTTI